MFYKTVYHYNKKTGFSKTFAEKIHSSSAASLLKR